MDPKYIPKSYRGLEICWRFSPWDPVVSLIYIRVCNAVLCRKIFWARRSDSGIHAQCTCLLMTRQSRDGCSLAMTRYRRVVMTGISGAVSPALCTSGHRHGLHQLHQSHRKEPNRCTRGSAAASESESEVSLPPRHDICGIVPDRDAPVWLGSTPQRPPRLGRPGGRVLS